MITLLDKQGREIKEQDKIMERIEEFYSELFDSDQAVTIQTDPKEVPLIMAWEVEAALRKMKNGKEAGKDQVNIETLKAGDETTSKAVHKVHNRTINPKNMEGSKYGDIFQERKQKRHQELQTNLLAIKYVQTVHKNHNN